jgi:DNA-binding transcriptional MerR regulator
MSDAALQRWIIQQQGAGLSPRQLRFWEAILGLPAAEVKRWLEATAGQPWQRRLNP